MKLHRLITTGVLMLSLAAGSALAQTEKAKKQTEVRKVPRPRSRSSTRPSRS